MNKYEWAANRPKQEVYHSTTLGPIPLSFNGRRLMQNLREAIQDMLRETIKAVKAGDLSSANWTDVSKARGHLAQYMSKLEKGVPTVEEERTAFEALCWKPVDSLLPSMLQPSTERISADLASALAHRACLGVEHDRDKGKLHGYCMVCGTQWPCPTAEYFLRETPVEWNPRDHAYYCASNEKLPPGITNRPACNCKP